MLTPAAPRRAARRLRVAAASAALAVLAVVGPAVTPAAAAAQAAAPAINWWEIHLYNRINGVRSLAGVGPISWHDTAGHQAGAWSEHMAHHGQLAHHAALTLEASAADPAWTGYAEIVGRGPDPDSVLEAFMASPGHRDKILGDWRAMGVGVADGHGQLWVTVRFIR